MGVRAAAGSGGMKASRPTNARAVAAVRFGRSFSLVCRGGPWPSRRPSGAAGFPGRCKHRPLHRLRRRGGSRFAAGFASPRRAGVHARRTAAIPKPECSPRRGVRRDEGIPPYGCPGGRSRSGLARNIKFIRRGGFHIRPRNLVPPQSPRDDASIVPYTGCGGAGVAVSRGVRPAT